MDKTSKRRCPWPANDQLMLAYHDTEWGVQLHDDQKLFEFLILEGMQAGLSWSIILKKRENFRRAFDNFDPEKIARYRQAKIKRLLQDTGIIRNHRKIEAVVTNARAFLKVRDEWGSFDEYIWRFTNGRMIVNRWKTLAEIPAMSREAEAMSKDLKQRDFKFIGPTICYAHMQATGMVNDHLVSCFRYKEVQ